MPRHTSTSPAKRVEALGRARLRAKKLKRGETLTARPMAKLIGVSWVTLRGWCNDIAGFAESDAFEGGAQGVDYVFKPLKTIDFLTKHFKAERDRRIQETRRLAQLVGAEDLIDPESDFSPEELNKILQLAERIEDRRLRQGELIDAATVREHFNAYHLNIQQSALRSAQEADPEGNWEPEFRQAFDDAMRKLLIRIQRAGRDCTSRLGAKGVTQPSG